MLVINVAINTAAQSVTVPVIVCNPQVGNVLSALYITPHISDTVLVKNLDLVPHPHTASTYSLLTICLSVVKSVANLLSNGIQLIIVCGEVWSRLSLLATL